MKALYCIYVPGSQVVCTYSNCKVRVWLSGDRGYQAARRRATRGRSKTYFATNLQ